MKFNAILGMAFLLCGAAGETIIQRRAFGAYVHNSKCPTFHHNDTTVFHINPEMAAVQVFMGEEKQTLIPFFNADEILKKSFYNDF